jgi:hypothetical protein
MQPTKGDSRGQKNPSDGGRLRASWPTILLGAALLACALALYWYASSNTPRTLREPDNLNNINRAAPPEVPR